MSTRCLFPFVTMLVVCLLDARAVAHSAESNATAVDTRTLTMTQLTVTGPASVPWGSQGAYTATLQYQGAAAQYVTAECEWSVSGGPNPTEWWDMAVMNGNILEPNVASPIPLQVRATVRRSTGQIVSAPFAVTMPESNGMNVGVAFVAPTFSIPMYLRTAGSQYVWRITAQAHGLAADKPGVTFQCSIDGQPLATGHNLDAEIPGLPSTRQLTLVATDPQGRQGRAYRYLAFELPAGFGESPTPIPALDPGDGLFVMEDEGNPNGGRCRLRSTRREHLTGSSS